MTELSSVISQQFYKDDNIPMQNRCAPDEFLLSTILSNMVKTLNKSNVNNKWIAFSLLGVCIAAIMLLSLNLPPWITILILTLFFLTIYISQQKNKKLAELNLDKIDFSATGNNARKIGLRLQGLGRLFLAFEKFKQCPYNHDTANLLYNLSIDFQIKGDPENAKRVLKHISVFAPNFKDTKIRLQSFESNADKSIADSTNLESDVKLPTVDQAAIDTKNMPSISRSIDQLTSDSIKADKINSEDIKKGFPPLYGNRYKVIKALGEGTTGAVFKGVDIVADTPVAIKVLNLTAELDESQLDEYKFRFHREIETAGNLDHPNIVKIFDNGESDGFAYIVMEYVDGINLRNYARADNLLNTKTLLKLIALCADALSYAHKQDVIHRDIKPANIIYNSNDDFIKLTDFGIAKIPDSTRTRAGSIIGTPLYMSPEQLAGESLDARSDLYSLGVTLYHLLTGSPPFRPKTMGELLRSITQERHKDIAEINPDTPSCIAWAVNKALEKDPDKRFQSAARMANKLRECLMMLDT